ncbi:minor capsid protein [Eubacterium sp.]|uniref:minor capsid protein n=1 Tax=Eubacterium sp. TaxID=142586 RepID=UPI002FC71E4F
MAKTTRVRIEMKSNQEILLKRHLNKNGKVQRAFTRSVRRRSDKYTPFLTGALKNTAVASESKITYVVPYARKNFFANRGRGYQGTFYGGLRGRNWANRMWAAEGDEVIAEMATIAGVKGRRR